MRHLVFRCKYVTLSGFVTQRPNYNARVVLVALYHGFHAVNNRDTPNIAAARDFAQCSMRFHVRFVDNVNTVLVTQIEHARVIGVMRHAKAIDIEALHDAHILFHAFVRNSTAIVRIQFVAVNTAELDRRIVDVKDHDPVGIALQFDFAEANAVAHNFGRFTRLILQRNHCYVEVRVFGRP